MQRGPPRPRPSSKPAIVMTSMPSRRSSGVGGDVALVGDDDAGRECEHVVAVVPLLALGLEAVAAGLEEPQLRHVEGGGDARQRVVGALGDGAVRAWPQLVRGEACTDVRVDRERVARRPSS